MTETTESTSTPLTFPRDGLPAVIETTADLRSAAEALHRGSGPVAIDAERASGYRYSSRAYLIQLRREGAGTFLIDPTFVEDMTPLCDVINPLDWILHASTQDIGCLVEVGLEPTSLFDTELAGRLLGRPKVGLGSLLESDLNVSLAKEHSAADWSTRPLPEPWLIYAALDVELLIELRELQKTELIERERWHWAEQEFAYLTSWRPPTQREEPWRRTSGIHTVRKTEQLAIVRELWQLRDQIAREKDKAPGRVLSDAGIIDIAKKEIKSARDIFKLESLRNRSHKALADIWWEARVRAIADPNPPSPSPKGNVLPPPKAWAEKNPEAAERWDAIRPAINAFAENLEIAPELIVSPDIVRRLCWEGGSRLSDESELREWLVAQGSRPWQVDLVVEVIVSSARAIGTSASQEPLS
jgi:ribonuclease D